MQLEKAKVQLPLSNPIVIHPEIANCPYCGEKLYITSIWEYSTDDDINHQAESIILECQNDPSIAEYGADKEMVKLHSKSPYIYWFPVQERVLKFLQENFVFVENQ